MIDHPLYLVIPEEDSGYDGGDVGHHQRHSYKDPLKLAMFRVREISIKLFLVLICNKSCNTTITLIPLHRSAGVINKVQRGVEDATEHGLEVAT